MMTMGYSFWRCVLVWLLYGQYNVSGDSLYSSGDHISTLTAHNFEENLRNADTAWVVEYYATWCGHCQRFAPVYRRFAQGIAGWSNVIKVGAIACSDPQNLPVCRSQRIRGYPSIKFYPAKMRTVSRGYKLNSLRFSSDSVRDAALQFITENGNPSTTWPQLSRYRSVSELQQHARSVSAEHLFAVVEDDRTRDSSLSNLIILDLSATYPATVVGRLPRSAIRDQAVIGQTAPFLVALNLHDNTIRTISRVDNREDTVQRIKAEVAADQASYQHTPVRPVVTRQPYTASTLPPLRTALLPDSTATTPIHGPTHTATPHHSMGIHQADLDSNIYYMLWNEVASRGRIQGRALPALKEYIRILSKYHPGNERLMSFIDSVHQWIQRLGGSLHGEIYINTLDGLQTNDSYVVKEVNWKSCAGTAQAHGTSQYRGYPCSLWMTFHALTVAAYETYLNNPERYFSPMEVLGAIRNYVHYYLGCRECAQHFQRMARRMESEAIRPEDVILWLWKTHNNVNNRLSGDETEDPAHPKIQFPSPTACPTCRNGDGPFDKFNNETRWNEMEVLKFLRQFYSKDNVIQSDQASHNDGTVTPPRQPPGRQSVPDVSAASNSCQLKETSWSTCSLTCGVGVSTRLSNNNTNCQMQMEMRICKLRPCDLSFGNYYRGRSGQYCATYSATQQDTRHTAMSFNNCMTVNTYRWYYCGLCTGYCCEPVSEGTFWADVTCDGHHAGKAQVSWIGRCECRPC